MEAQAQAQIEALGQALQAMASMQHYHYQTYPSSPMRNDSRRNMETIKLIVSCVQCSKSCVQYAQIIN